MKKKNEYGLFAKILIWIMCPGIALSVIRAGPIE